MKKLMIIITGIFCFSQHLYAAELNHVQKGDIKKAVVEMLTKTTDPFVIVEISETKKYVQFYNDKGSILIDFPNIGLTPEEKKAATKYFNTKEIKLQQSVDKDPTNMKTIVTETWTETYPPKQIDLVVDISLGTLYEVYGIKYATPLTITKGWE